MTASKIRSVLHRLATEINRFGVSASQIMRGGEAHKKYCVLRVVRAHSERQLQMRNGFVRLSVEGQRRAKVTVSGSKVRVYV